MDIICSIIIPVYNAEKTLLKTISSVREINNNLSVEIILVDDGSTDKSLEICQEQAALDKRIVIVNKKNGGVSSARNYGIKCARGKFVYFIDADDTVSPDGVISIVEKMEKFNLDLAIADYEEYNITDGKLSNISSKLSASQLLYRDYIKKEILKRLYLGDNVGLCNIWNKIFKTDIIKKNNIRFDEERTHGEDWKFVIDYLFCTSRAMAFNYVIYRYYLDGSQTLSKYRKGLIQSVITSINIKEKLLDVGQFEINRKDKNRVIFEQFRGVIKFLNYNMSREERLIIKHDKSIKSLCVKILKMPFSAVKDAQMSRIVYAIAICLYMGCLPVTQKLLRRGI